MNKYEQLIEHIINENEEAARELFHSIVVEKSREIYESLMDEDQMDENIDQYDQGNDLASDVMRDETQGLGEEDLEDTDLDVNAPEEGGDDMDGLGMGDMGGGEEGEASSKFQEVRDILDDLEAEFADIEGGGAPSGDEEIPTDDDTGISGSGDVTGEFGGAPEGEEEPEGEEQFAEGKQPPWLKGSGSGKSGSGASGSGKSGSGKSGSGKSGSGKAMSEAELMREYVEKIAAPSNTEGTAVGTGNKTPKVSVNTKNPLAGKNDMGGSAKNIANGKSDAGDVDGNSPKGKAGGFVKPAQEIDVAKRNVNKVGGNKGAQDFYNTKAKGKDAEGSTTDGSVSVNKQSLEGGRK